MEASMYFTDDRGRIHRRALNQPGTLREQLDIIHGRVPPEPFDEEFMGRFMASVNADPVAFGELCIACMEQARAAKEAVSSGK